MLNRDDLDVKLRRAMLHHCLAVIGGGFFYCCAVFASDGPTFPLGLAFFNGSIGTLLLGMLGALLMYVLFCWRRAAAIYGTIWGTIDGLDVKPTANGVTITFPTKKMLIFDLVVGLVFGGVAAVIFATDGNHKEAFLLGTTWQSLVVGILSQHK